MSQVLKIDEFLSEGRPQFTDLSKSVVDSNSDITRIIRIKDGEQFVLGEFYTFKNVNTLLFESCSFRIFVFHDDMITVSYEIINNKLDGDFESYDDMCEINDIIIDENNVFSLPWH